MLTLNEQDPTKTEVTTRDGRPAEIYAVKEGQRYSILGAFMTNGGEWCSTSWAMSGHYLHKCDEDVRDLINAPPKPQALEMRLARCSDGQWIDIGRCSPEWAKNNSYTASKLVKFEFVDGVFE
jgi:hypothetical protein